MGSMGGLISQERHPSIKNYKNALLKYNIIWFDHYIGAKSEVAAYKMPNAYNDKLHSKHNHSGCNNIQIQDNNIGIT